MENNGQPRGNIDEIMNVFHHKKSVEAPEDFTNNTMHRIFRQNKSKEFYLPLGFKIAAAIILIVVNMYTIYFFAGHESPAAPAVPGALVRFYQPADTSVDFAYQSIRNK